MHLSYITKPFSKVNEKELKLLEKYSSTFKNVMGMKYFCERKRKTGRSIYPLSITFAYKSKELIAWSGQFKSGDIWVFVRKEYRRKGIGTKLIRRCKNVKSVCRAKKFYKALGLGSIIDE